MRRLRDVILELTLRSWIHTEENKRRTLQKNDIAAAITRTDIFDFLVDIVPRDELNKEDGIGVPRGTMPVGSPVSYEGVYYVPTPQGPVPQPAMVSPAMMGNQMSGARPAMATGPHVHVPSAAAAAAATAHAVHATASTNATDVAAADNANACHSAH